MRNKKPKKRRPNPLKDKKLTLVKLCDEEKLALKLVPILLDYLEAKGAIRGVLEIEEGFRE